MKKTLLHILMHNGRLLRREVEAELFPLGLHHGQGRMLQVIARAQNITQADLARQMDIKPATVTNMLKPLIARKLVCRELDPVTNRAMVVSLTSRGESLCIEIDAAWQRVEQRMVHSFSKKELMYLFQGLEKVRNILGGKGPEEEVS